MKKNQMGFLQKALANKRLCELARYCVFGVLTTVVNIGVYQFLLLFLDYRISNLIALLAAKLFAYVTNKLFVFGSHCGSMRELLGEIFRFVAARGFTGLLDYFGLIAAVELFRLDPVYSKYALQFLVIVLNYVLGKRAVYLNRQSND